MVETKGNEFKTSHAILVLFQQKIFPSINIWCLNHLPSEQHQGGLDMTRTAPPAHLDAVQKAWVKLFYLRLYLMLLYPDCLNSFENIGCKMVVKNDDKSCHW